MNWEKKQAEKQADTSQIIEAKIEVRKAARIVADCPHCTEGWRSVNNHVVRCECWDQYCNAFGYLRNLDSQVFVEDGMVNFKPAPPPEDQWVPLDQIREMRESVERMAVARGVIV